MKAVSSSSYARAMQNIEADKALPDIDGITESEYKNNFPGIFTRLKDAFFRMLNIANIPLFKRHINIFATSAKDIQKNVPLRSSYNKNIKIFRKKTDDLLGNKKEKNNNSNKFVVLTMADKASSELGNSINTFNRKILKTYSEGEDSDSKNPLVTFLNESRQQLKEDSNLDSNVKDTAIIYDTKNDKNDEQLLNKYGVDSVVLLKTKDKNGNFIIDKNDIQKYFISLFDAAITQSSDKESIDIDFPLPTYTEAKQDENLKNTEAYQEFIVNIMSSIDHCIRLYEKTQKTKMNLNLIIAANHDETAADIGITNKVLDDANKYCKNYIYNIVSSTNDFFNQIKNDSLYSRKITAVSTSHAPLKNYLSSQPNVSDDNISSVDSMSPTDLETANLTKLLANPDDINERSIKNLSSDKLQLHYGNIAKLQHANDPGTPIFTKTYNSSDNIIEKSKQDNYPLKEITTSTGHKCFFLQNVILNTGTIYVPSDISYDNLNFEEIYYKVAIYVADTDKKEIQTNVYFQLPVDQDNLAITANIINKTTDFLANKDNLPNIKLVIPTDRTDRKTFEDISSEISKYYPKTTITPAADLNAIQAHTTDDKPIELITNNDTKIFVGNTHRLSDNLNLQFINAEKLDKKNVTSIVNKSISQQMLNSIKNDNDYLVKELILADNKELNDIYLAYDKKNNQAYIYSPLQNPVVNLKTEELYYQAVVNLIDMHKQLGEEQQNNIYFNLPIAENNLDESTLIVQKILEYLKGKSNLPSINLLISDTKTTKETFNNLVESLNATIKTEVEPQQVTPAENSTTTTKDTKIANVIKNLDNIDEIERSRKDIVAGIEKLTKEQLSKAEQAIENDIKNNKTIKLGSIKIVAGSIEKTSNLGMKNAYIMNAANPTGSDGFGVTGSIFRESNDKAKITTEFQTKVSKNHKLAITDKDDNIQKTKDGDSQLAMGQIVVTDSYGIKDVSGIIHAVAPQLTPKGREKYLIGKKDIHVALAANSFEKAIRYAAKQKKDGKACDSLALVLLGGNIYGGDTLDILTALKIAEERVRDDKDVQALDIRLITYKTINKKQINALAKLNVIGRT